MDEFDLFLVSTSRNTKYHIEQIESKQIELQSNENTIIYILYF